MDPLQPFFDYLNSNLNCYFLPQTEFSPFILITVYQNSSVLHSKGQFLAQANKDRKANAIPSAVDALSILINTLPTSTILTRRKFVGQAASISAGTLIVTIGGVEKEAGLMYLKIVLDTLTDLGLK